MSGYLSFSHIGGMPVRNRTFAEDIHPPTKFLEDEKYISLLQVRNLSDRPTVGPINSNPANGRFRFLLQAELVNSVPCRQLAGIVVCAPAALSEPISKLHEAARLNTPSTSSSLAAAAIVNLQHQLGTSFFAVSFTLADDGVIELDSMANASPTDAGGPLRAFEAYSFIKDVLHRHRFHSPTDDALLELTANSANINLWADRAARNLHRSVISSFRSTSPSAQVDGLGKLSYLESFMKVLERRKITLDLLVSTGSLRSAIEANQSRGILEREEKSLLLAYMMSLAAIALPILFVCLQLLQMPCIERLTYSDSCEIKFQVPDIMLDVAMITLAWLHWVIIVASLLAATLVLILGKKRLHAYISGKLALATWTTDLRDLIFRLAVSSRLLAIGILLAFSVAIVWLTWGVITSAVGP